ncbi:MAG TPA: hypothetical protein VFE53_12780 [Mucilaginibacter sp.]|jgi:hypothetical protein|nr:hypothetical protein [Mucilaginibacter sp.]
MNEITPASRFVGEKTPTKEETYFSVNILKTYPIQLDCTPKIRYANLYICKRRLANFDTILVFNECEKPHSFAVDTGLNIEVGFFTRDVFKNPPKHVTVFVPREFNIPKNARYVFVRLVGTVL